MKKGADGIYNKIIKRGIDITLSSILLIPSSVLILLCAVAVKLEDGDKAFFTQDRPGYKGKIFKIYKIRTMSNKTVENNVVLTDMQRMTKSGKIIRALSLDELPQLFNILKGDMSFIGPRPLLTQYLSLYTPFEMRRHDLRPGMSGWAQVNGRNEISWEQKFARDVWYVDNVSFMLDMKIFFLTLANVLNRSGVNAGSNETMQVFTGSSKDLKEEKYE